jgi:hypothetical protein
MYMCAAVWISETCVLKTWIAARVGSGNFRSLDFAGRSRSLTVCLRRLYPVPVHSSLSASWLPWDETIPPPRPSAMVICTHRPRNTEPRDHGLKSLKLWAKVSHSSLSVASLRYLLQWQTVWLTKRTLCAMTHTQRV